MATSALAFAAMGACVKALGTRLPSQEIVFARALVSLVLSFVMLRRAGVPPLGRSRGLLLLRGLFGFTGLSCVFYAVTHLPLAEATVLQYLHPVFTAFLAAVVLGERIGRGLALGLPLAIGGVVMVARPGFLFGGGASGGAGALDPFAVGIAVAGALASACAYVTVRRLAATEHPLVIVLYFPLVATPATLPTLAAGFVLPQGVEWVGLLAVGLLAQLGQVALTRGMRHETAARATALSYLQVVFAAGFGVLFFHELLDAATLAGAGLVLLGSFVAGRPPTPR